MKRKNKTKGGVPSSNPISHSKVWHHACVISSSSTSVVRYRMECGHLPAQVEQIPCGGTTHARVQGAEARRKTPPSVPPPERTGTYGPFETRRHSATHCLCHYVAFHPPTTDLHCLERDGMEWFHVRIGLLLHAVAYNAGSPCVRPALHRHLTMKRASHRISDSLIRNWVFRFGRYRTESGTIA